MGIEESLGLLVDGLVVHSAYLVRLEEGIVASWPPGSVDREILGLVESLVVPLEPGLYVVLGGGRLQNRYVGLVVGAGILLLRVGDEVPAEAFAKQLSRICSLLKGYEERVKRIMGAMSNSGSPSPMIG